MNNIERLYKQYAQTRNETIKEQIQVIVRRVKNQNGYATMLEAEKAIHNAIRRKRRPNGSPGRMQPAGRAGCWFFPILNGFLLSYRAKQLLKKRLQQYKNTNLAQFQRAVGAAGPVCPMPGKLNSGLFWSYINERLRTGSRAINATVNQNRLILNLKLKRPGENLEGAGGTEIKKFIKDLWPEFGTPRSPILVLRYRPQYGEGVPAMIRLTPGRPEYNKLKNRGSGLYRVSHADITGARMGGEGHALLGYVKQDGTQMVYDSNDVNAFQCDWRTNWKCVRDHLASKYNVKSKSAIRVYYDVVYIRSDAANNNTGAQENNVPIAWPPVSYLPIEERHRKNYNKFRRLNSGSFGPRVSPNKPGNNASTISRYGRPTKKPKL